MSVEELGQQVPRKYRRAIRWGWLLFFGCAVLHMRWFDDVYLALGWVELAPVRSFFYTVGHHLLAVTLSLMMIFGLRQLKKSGFSVRRCMMPLFAALIMIGLSVFFFNTSKLLLDWIHRGHDYTRTLNRILEVKVNDSALPLADRATLSLIYARNQYVHHGIQVEYFTAEGHEILFEPNAVDAAEHATWSKTQAAAGRAKIIFFIGGIFWPTVFTVSFILSCVPAVRRPGSGPLIASPTGRNLFLPSETGAYPAAGELQRGTAAPFAFLMRPFNGGFFARCVPWQCPVQLGAKLFHAQADNVQVLLLTE